MKYKRFEELPVWQTAADLAARMFGWTGHSSFRGKGDLANQLQRATLSISNNIAEGFERGTTKELLTFLYYARGSAGEVRSMLCVMHRMVEFDDLKSEISDFRSTCESISRQIRAWAASMQDSDIAGQRYLTGDTRKHYEQEQRRTQFEETIKENVRKATEDRLRREHTPDENAGPDD